ncbi:ral guanine nucleotide dissociation stimulator-like [Thomomys bottae]
MLFPWASQHSPPLTHALPGQEYAIMEQLKQLQASCSYEHITPDEKFLGWFRDLERLSEEASYDLSCTLEPPGQNDTASPPTKKRFSIWKAWKNHQTQSAAISTSGGSQLKWMDQDKSGPEMSSTNTTAVQSDSNVQSAPSSSSYPELITSISQTSSGDPKKVQGSSSRSTGMTSLASASQSSPTDTSTMDTNSANTHSGTSGQSSDSSSVLPHLRLGDSCVIRVVLPVENRRLCRSIEVTNQEKTRDVIVKAIKKFQVRGYKPEDLELVQIITQDQKLRIPDDANVFYALKTMDVYHVVLRKYTFPRRTPAKQRSSFSLFHRKRRGSKA